MSNSVKCEAILDSDDFEIDDIITEFAKEERKKDEIIKITDSDEEMETLLDEFAETQSNSDCDENKSSAKVILSSSDDDMDDLIEEFREEISSETESPPIEEKPNLSQKNQSETRTIIIQDSDNNNGTIYDSSVEILISDDIDNKSEENFALDENEYISTNEPHFTSLSEENDKDSIEEEAIKCPNDDSKTGLDIKRKEEFENDVIPTESIVSAQSEEEKSGELDDAKSSCSNNILPEDKSENLPNALQSSDKKDLMSNTEGSQQENNASISEKYAESSNVLPSDKCVSSSAAPIVPGDPSVLVRISNAEKSDIVTNIEMPKPKVLKDNNEAGLVIEIFSTSEANADVLPKNTSVKQNIPEAGANVDVLPKDTSVNQNIPEDEAIVDVLPKDVSVNQNIPEDEANVDVLPKDVSVNQNIPEDEANIDVLPKDVSVNQNIPEDEANVDVLPKDTSMTQNIPVDEANVDVLSKDTSVNQNIPDDESLDSAKSEIENLFSDSDSMDDNNKIIFKISKELDDLEAMSDSTPLPSDSEQADMKSDDQCFLSVDHSDSEDNAGQLSDVQKVLNNLITKIETTKLCLDTENDCNSTSDDKIEVMDVDLNVTLTSIVPSVEIMKNILASVKLNDSILKQDVEMGSNGSKEDGPELEVTNDSSDVINQSEKSKESSGESLGNQTANVESLPESTSVTVYKDLNKAYETLPTVKDADSPIAGDSECEIEEISIIESDEPKSNAFKTAGTESKTNISSTENFLSVTEDIVKETLNNHYNEIVSKESKKRKLEVSDEETANKVKRIDNGEDDVSPMCLVDSSDDECSGRLHPGKEKVLWSSEKLVVTDKDIEKMALESIKKALDTQYSEQSKEVTTKLDVCKVQYEKISEIVDYVRKMQSEFRCNQKLAMLKAGYTKLTFRTVGVNVKICKEIEVRKPSLIKKTETVEIIGEKSVPKETIKKAYKRPKTPEKKYKPTFTPNTPELPTSKSTIDLPSTVVCKENLLIPENVPQSQSQPVAKKVPVTSATQRTPLPNILKPAVSRSVVEPPKDLLPKKVTPPVPVIKVPTMNGEVKGTPRGANVLIPFNEFLQMLPNAGRGFILPQTRPSSGVPTTSSTSVVRTIMLPRQDPRINAGQPFQTFFQNQPNQQIYRGQAFQVANAVQRKPTAVCPVRPMMMQAPTQGNQLQKVAPVTMRYNQNFRSANFTTPSGQTTVFTQYRPVSSVFHQPLQPSQPTTSTVHHVPSTTSTVHHLPSTTSTVHHLPSKLVQSPARYTSTSLYGPSLLKQSLITPSNPPLIGQPLAATKEYVQSLNTKPYPRVPVSPSYSDTNAKLLPPKPELKASKKNDNKSIVLSWNLALTDKHAAVTGYHIFSCQVKNTNNETKGWKKTGEVGAMVLPMACTLQQFEHDTIYYFIVRAIDKLQRLGPFSEPVSVNF